MELKKLARFSSSLILKKDVVGGEAAFCLLAIRAPKAGLAVLEGSSPLPEFVCFSWRPGAEWHRVRRGLNSGSSTSVVLLETSLER
mmetsp:Transcript_103364/g.318920  ORF Transcript_103364/g.318920 Transcript_103364/m.318920 type:complete len:86 (-) Transcript_103364:486-743(-)